VPTQPPLITSTLYAPGSVTIQGTNGAVGGLYHLLSSTNVALPLAAWVPVQTNAFGPGGSFSALVPVNPGEPVRFYLLQLP
jgi:hypothetical protein